MALDTSEGENSFSGSQDVLCGRTVLTDNAQT